MPGRADLARTWPAGSANTGRDMGRRRGSHTEKGMGHTLGDPSISQLCPSSPAQLRVLRGLFLLCWGGPPREGPPSTTMGRDSGSGTLRSLWRGLDGQWAIDREPWGATGEEAPRLAGMGPPQTPHSHCQLAGCSLVPSSPAQRCHNLQLRDCSWQGTSLEINSDDIPANSGHGHNRITGLG